MTAPVSDDALTEAELYLCGDMARDGIAFAKRHAALLAENARVRDYAERMDALAEERAIALAALRHECDGWKCEAIVRRDELAALRADAERMDWLQQHMLAIDFDYNGDTVVMLNWPKSVAIGKNLRKSIDIAIAAIAKGGAPQEEK